MLVYLVREGIVMELTILMPCLNEAKTIEKCIKKHLAFYMIMQ